MLHAINQANVPACGSETLDAMGELLAMSRIAIGVESEGELAGFCYVLEPGQPYGSANYTWFSGRYTSFAYLDRVAFAAEHQGKGHGAALYRAVEERAAPWADWFLLEVNLVPRNDGSLRFHEREGFAEVGQRGTPEKLVSLMAKRL